MTPPPPQTKAVSKERTEAAKARKEAERQTKGERREKRRQARSQGARGGEERASAHRVDATPAKRELQTPPENPSKGQRGGPLRGGGDVKKSTLSCIPVLYLSVKNETFCFHILDEYQWGGHGKSQSLGAESTKQDEGATWKEQASAFGSAPTRPNRPGICLQPAPQSAADWSNGTGGKKRGPEKRIMRQMRQYPPKK